MSRACFFGRLIQAACGNHQEKSCRRHPILISSAAAVSTGLPLSEFFFLFWFFFFLCTEHTKKVRSRIPVYRPRSVRASIDTMGDFVARCEAPACKVDSNSIGER